MPRKSKSKAQPDSPAGHPAVDQALVDKFTADMAEKNLPALKTGAEMAKEQLAEYEAQPLTPAVQIKTARPLIGRVASGRGRVITADDSSYAIESANPLTAGEIALAQRNGFDDFSEKGDGRIMVADKAEMRKANADINWVARAVTGKDAGRGR